MNKNEFEKAVKQILNKDQHEEVLKRLEVIPEYLREDFLYVLKGEPNGFKAIYLFIELAKLSRETPITIKGLLHIFTVISYSKTVGDFHFTAITNKSITFLDSYIEEFREIL